MRQIGVRELRRDASAILRRVATGETIEITNRGRPVAVILKSMAAGLERLEREGLIRHAEADLLRVRPYQVPPGAVLPSALVSEGREEPQTT
jgi:prevent-host-death family protein